MAERLTYLVAEVASLTGLSADTIRRPISRGNLKAVRVARRIVVPAGALAAFLEQAEEVVPEPAAPAARNPRLRAVGRGRR